MNLEQRYTTAPATSYVGKVRDSQAADVGGNKAGVNFMGGTTGKGNGSWQVGTTAAPDEVQTEFTRNAAGDFRYEGGGKIPGKYSLSRWLTPGLIRGDQYMRDNSFTTLVKGDVRNAVGSIMHKYTNLANNTTFISKLSSSGKGRVQGSAVGPSPAGLAG